VWEYSLALACNLSIFAFEGVEDVAFPGAGKGEDLEDLVETCLTDTVDYRWEFWALDDDPGTRSQKCTVEFELEDTGDVGQMWSLYTVVANNQDNFVDWHAMALEPGEYLFESNSHTIYTESAGDGETYELVLRVLVCDDRPECVRVLPGGSLEVENAIGERMTLLENPCE
jgi:hypothetical protein